MNISEEQYSESKQDGSFGIWHRETPRIFSSLSSQNRRQTRRISPFALYQNEELSPRASSWINLAASSLAGLATILVVESPFRNRDERHRPDTLLILILSTSFALSLLISICYRHRGLRTILTKEIAPYMSLELLSAISIFILWCVELRYVMDPLSGVEYGLVLTNKIWGQHYYEDIWNGNLWVSSWLGWGIAAFLVGELFMAPADKRKGVVETGVKKCSATTGEESYKRTFKIYKDGSTYWFLILVLSCAISAFCINYRIGKSCDGNLSSTSFCKRCVLGSTVGLMCGTISLGALILHFVYLRGNTSELERQQHKKLWSLEAFCSISSLILNSINVGFVTSPGGPGAQIGNLFLTAWLGLIISLSLLLHVEKGWTLRITQPIETVPFDDTLINRKMDEHGGTRENNKSQIPNQQRDNNAQVVHKKSSRPRQFSYENRNNNISTGLRGDVISKSNDRNSSSSNDSSSSSSSDSSSSSSTDCSGNTNNIQRMDSNGKRISGDKSISTYSLPLPPPICLDSSSDDQNYSHQSLSPTLVFLTGEQISSQAMQNTNSTPSSLLTYNNHRVSYEKDDPVGQAHSIDEDADDDSAVEICVEHPDDVSSLSISVLSIEPSLMEPDGYKSEDNYNATSDQYQTSNRKSYKRASSTTRRFADELSTVEEKSQSTQNNIDNELKN